MYREKSISFRQHHDNLSWSVINKSSFNLFVCFVLYLQINSTTTILMPAVLLSIFATVCLSASISHHASNDAFKRTQEQAEKTKSTRLNASSSMDRNESKISDILTKLGKYQVDGYRWGISVLHQCLPSIQDP